MIGGTGDYADAPAEIHQTLLGMSDGHGVRLQMRFAETTARSTLHPNERTFAELDAATLATKADEELNLGPAADLRPPALHHRRCNIATEAKQRPVRQRGPMEKADHGDASRFAVAMSSPSAQ